MYVLISLLYVLLIFFFWECYWLIVIGLLYMIVVTIVVQVCISFLEPSLKTNERGIKTKPNPTLNGVGLNDLFELYVHYYYLGNILHV